MYLRNIAEDAANLDELMRTGVARPALLEGVAATRNGATAGGTGANSGMAETMVRCAGTDCAGSQLFLARECAAYRRPQSEGCDRFLVPFWVNKLMK